MIKGQEVEQEYLNMRAKVESRISELQSRLSPCHSHNNSNSNLMSPRSCRHMHNHHPHHCHVNHRPSPSHFSINLPEQINSQLATPSIRVVQTSDSSNDLLGQALIQSIKSQQQINDNIRNLSDKIEKLTQQQARSHNQSEVFSENTTKKHKKTPLFKQFFTDVDKPRSNSSDIRQQYVLPSPKQQQTPMRKLLFKKPKNKKKSAHSNSSSNVLSISKAANCKNDKSNSKQSKSNSKGHYKSQYFLSFGCPLHSADKISLKRLKMGQIYKDSQHRNRKHQKDHLIGSFHQQERSRKRLISKIQRSLFNQYGTK